jgi:hypothetical protein
LPSEQNCPANFLREILADRKKLILTTDLRKVEAPSFKEFTVDSIYKICESDAEVLAHLPNLDMAKKPPDREFSFNILNTLRADFVFQNINHAYNTRITELLQVK